MLLEIYESHGRQAGTASETDVALYDTWAGVSCATNFRRETISPSGRNLVRGNFEHTAFSLALDFAIFERSMKKAFDCKVQHDCPEREQGQTGCPVLQA